MSVISDRTRKFAKRAGIVILGLVALDLAAGAAALALGLTVLRK
jgi:hypothetical protein